MSVIERETIFNGQLTDRNQVVKFILAGNATITLVSKKTGVRFTYKVNKKAGENFWFVSLLTGSDNETDYKYFGHIDFRWRFHFGRKAKIAFDSPSAVAWRWFYPRLDALLPIFDQVEVWHEGKCGRCNRKLTVPSSIEHGFGPECINHV